MKKTLLLLTSLLVINAYSQVKKIWAKPFINQIAPELEVEKWLGAKPDIKGKFVLIDFWATWCGPCKRVIPDLNKFKSEFEKDLIVIGISDETEEKIKSLSEPKIEYYSAIDTQKKMSNTLEIQGIPHCILIDPNGIVRWEGYPILTGYQLTSSVIKGIIEEYEANTIIITSTDYSNYTLKELTDTKTAMELELNYSLVNHYLEKIERNEISLLATTKIDKTLIYSYWKNVSELKNYREEWEKTFKEREKFIKKEAPEITNFKIQLQTKIITKDEFADKFREIHKKLLEKYPTKYVKLSQNLGSSSKTMWIKTVRYILEDYKNQQKNFPTNWIPEKDFEISKKTIKHKNIDNEIEIINTEIARKS